MVSKEKTKKRGNLAKPNQVGMNKLWSSLWSSTLQSNDPSFLDLQFDPQLCLLGFLERGKLREKSYPKGWWKMEWGVSPLSPWFWTYIWRLYSVLSTFKRSQNRILLVTRSSDLRLSSGLYHWIHNHTPIHQIPEISETLQKTSQMDRNGPLERMQAQNPFQSQQGTQNRLEMVKTSQKVVKAGAIITTIWSDINV